MDKFLVLGVVYIETMLGLYIWSPELLMVGLAENLL